MMSSSATMTDDNVDVLELLSNKNWKEYIVNQIKLSPKLSIADHDVNIEVTIEDDELNFFMQKAKEDLRETPEIVAQGIKELKELLAGEPDLRFIDCDDLYTLFLRPCKWYAQSAFSLIKQHFRFRQKYSHIFANLIPSKEKNGLCSGLTYPLPRRGKDGCRIFMLEVGKQWNPKKVSLEELFKGMIMYEMISTLEPKTQIAGARLIIDFEGLSMSQLTYYSVSFAKMVTDYVQKALPMRLKSVHIVNQPIIFNIIFAVFKPFLEEKTHKRIHFHGKNRESLMTFIDKSALLIRHGGELNLTDRSFNVNLWKTACSLDSIFLALTKLGYTNEN